MLLKWFPVLHYRLFSAMWLAEWNFSTESNCYWSSRDWPNVTIPTLHRQTLLPSLPTCTRPSPHGWGLVAVGRGGGKGTKHEISPRTCFTLGIRWPAFPWVPAETDQQTPSSSAPQPHSWSHAKSMCACMCVCVCVCVCACKLGGRGCLWPGARIRNREVTLIGFLISSSNEVGRDPSFKSRFKASHRRRYKGFLPCNIQAQFSVTSAKFNQVQPRPTSFGS